MDDGVNRLFTEVIEGMTHIAECLKYEDYGKDAWCVLHMLVRLKETAEREGVKYG